MSDLNPYEEGLANDLAKAMARNRQLRRERDAAVERAKEASQYLAIETHHAEQVSEKLDKAIDLLRRHFDPMAVSEKDEATFWELTREKKNE
jgi:hypothetical protein